MATKPKVTPGVLEAQLACNVSQKGCNTIGWPENTENEGQKATENIKGEGQKRNRSIDKRKQWMQAIDKGVTSYTRSRY